jgi:putative DNA primase/helicase
MIAFKPSHTLLLLTNHRPRAKSNEYALWQRLRLIPFNLSFVDFPKQENERQKDPDLIEKLTVERPGILAWFVRGCLDYQRDGLAPPRQVIAATEEYRSSQDMIQDFLNACCAFDQDSSERAGKVYERFQSWHKLVYGERIKVPGLKTFSAEMQRKVKRTPGRLTYYEGLRLLNE